jgi:hypothetical protein
MTKRSKIHVGYSFVGVFLKCAMRMLFDQRVHYLQFVYNFQDDKKWSSPKINFKMQWPQLLVEENIVF